MSPKFKRSIKSRPTPSKPQLPGPEICSLSTGHMTLPLATGPVTCCWCAPALGRLLPITPGACVERLLRANKSRAGGRFLSHCRLPGGGSSLWTERQRVTSEGAAALLRRHSWPKGTDPPSLLIKVTHIQSEKHPCFLQMYFPMYYCYHPAEIIYSF